MWESRREPSLVQDKGFLWEVGNARSFLQLWRVCVTKQVLVVMVHVGENWFQLIANARKIRVDRRGFNMVRHINSKETEHIRSGLDQEIV
jgi:hypothetical protein